jgi:hypothetical protein
MKLPIDKALFNNFIIQSNIFELTQKMMYQYLDSWYKDEPKQFIVSMGTDFDTVIQTYHFFNEIVSFNKNFNFDPPMDTISCIIRISDAEDICCTNYKAVFDYNLQAIDDYLFS